MYPVRLRGPRVVLREHDVGDAAAYHEITGDPGVARYAVWRPTTSVDDAASWLEAFAGAAAKPLRTRYHLAVEELATGRLVGGVDLVVEGHGQAELGCAARACFASGTSSAASGETARCTPSYSPSGPERALLARIHTGATPDGSIATSRARTVSRLGPRLKEVVTMRTRIRRLWFS